MTTQVLGQADQDLGRAAAILASGGLVSFPTETVYGLGADATNDRAVARIFDAKGRPRFNPLIVHVSDLEMAQRFGVIEGAALEFVTAHWPAAVTVVVPLREGTALSDLVTAGNDSVALRMPAAPLARRLIQKFGTPLAAPSANPSGRISPTTARHVLDSLSGKIDAVIDGGAAQVGLESTIIGFLGDGPVLLREGAFTDLPANITRKTSFEGAPTAPGQLASHYAPNAPVRLNAQMAEAGEFLIGFGDVTGDISLSPTGDLIEAAANLYAALHQADAQHVTRLAVAPIPDKGLGRAINDRLRRAAAPRD